jgi:outer membrane receptor protein involved in Fe transport
LAGFRSNAGIVWQGQRLGSNGARTPAAPDPLMLPSFARLDAAASYRFANRLELALNLVNALDSLIFVGGTVGSNLEIASPRALTARVGYEWR